MMVARLSLLLLLQAAVAVWGARQSHSAIVTGATGAVGRFITAELLASGAWDKVTTIGR